MGRERNKKIITALVMIVMLAASFIIITGCSSDDSGASCRDILDGCRKIAREGSFDTLVSYGEELYDDSFDNLYGIQFKDISDGAILYTESGGLADEISIVCMKDNNDVQVAKQKLQERIEERRNTFAGYKPEEVYKLDNAIVIIQGNYAALIISDDNEGFEAEIRKIISEGAE
ncbi:MAG: DUF4358 domain-containing protein [Anaerovoracaceae bacterium]